MVVPRSGFAIVAIPPSSTEGARNWGSIAADGRYATSELVTEILASLVAAGVQRDQMQVVM